uniref:Ribosomal protein L16 n=1 Tax=Coscinodiscus wailesii TaxID=671091 RepID=A0A7T8G3B4_9STRA|nr:ribosomal protein L16 [Coscinodiscus wailesii]QQP21855.1 ribosomal protein L16 [Coscinodiscus wailesii]
MLLSPKKIKYKKVKKGRLKKFNYKAHTLKFGTIGIKSIESGVISAKNIEAARQSINRKIQRNGKLWIRVFPHIPIMSKSLGVRMGKGKGSIHNWSAKITAGMILFEICGVVKEKAKTALNIGATKLPIKTKILSDI